MRRITVAWKVIGAFVLGSLLLIPLSAIIGYSGSLIMFGVLALLAGSLVALGAGLRLNDAFQVHRESAGAYSILGIHGVDPDGKPGQAIQQELRQALAAAPGAHPMACACIREVDGGFAGIARLGVPGSHAYHEVRGGSKGTAAGKLGNWLQEHRSDWQSGSRTAPVATMLCNRDVCPLGGASAAFAEQVKA